MKLPRINTFAAFGGLVLLAATVALARTLTAAPPQKPREVDAKRAERTAVMPGVTDDRTNPPIDGYIAGNAVVEPATRELRIGAVVPGVVSILHVNEGDFVKAGDLLAELDNVAEKAALVTAEANVELARANYEKVKAGLRAEDVDAARAQAEAAAAKADLSAAQAERQKELKAQGMTSTDAYDAARRLAEVDRATAKAVDAARRAAEKGSRAEDVRIAKAQYELAAAQRNEAKMRYERLAVRAPEAGTVLQIKLRPGEYFIPQGGEPIMILGDTRKLRARVDIDERYAGRIAAGAEAYVTCDAQPGRRFPARVTEVALRMGRKNIRTDDPVERIDTKIYEVVLELETFDGLIPGLRVTGYVKPAASRL